MENQKYHLVTYRDTYRSIPPAYGTAVIKGSVIDFLLESKQEELEAIEAHNPTPHTLLHREIVYVVEITEKEYGKALELENWDINKRATKFEIERQMASYAEQGSSE